MSLLRRNSIDDVALYAASMHPTVAGRVAKHIKSHWVKAISIETTREV